MIPAYYIGKKIDIFKQKRAKLSENNSLCSFYLKIDSLQIQTNSRYKNH